MADTSLFTRLRRLFSNDVIIRNVGGKQLKVMDVDRIFKVQLIFAAGPKNASVPFRNRCDEKHRCRFHFESAAEGAPERRTDRGVPVTFRDGSEEVAREHGGATT